MADQGLVDDSSPEAQKEPFRSNQRIWIDERNFNVILVGISGVTIVLGLIVILTMATRAVQWASGKGRKE